jgi:hypothetical protein
MRKPRRGLGALRVDIENKFNGGEGTRNSHTTSYTLLDIALISARTEIVSMSSFHQVEMLSHLFTAKSGCLQANPASLCPFPSN